MDFIHHKNMRYLCESTTDWVEKNLSQFGIFDFGCNFLNINDNSYLPLVSDYHLYCEYMDQNLHLQMLDRLHLGINQWNKNPTLLQSYDDTQIKLNAQLSRDYEPSKNTYHIDWVMKTKSGFQVFYCIGHRSLDANDLLKIKQYLHIHAYEASKIKKYKPKALIDLPTSEEITARFHAIASHENGEPIRYQKAEFDGVILTGKEQEYIEHLVFHRTHKDIAQRYQVTETAVRHIICNIKRKLGNENMPTTTMFALLNETGALAACMGSVRQY
jgi:DNA-binding CsgD family transcriptional regulator